VIEHAPKGFAKCRQCGVLFQHETAGRKPQWCSEHQHLGVKAEKESKKRSEVLHRYGVSLEIYRERLRDAECAICGTTQDLVYDHDHATSAFRGVLCRYHNKIIGALGDTAQDAWKVFQYLIGVPTRPDKHAYFMLVAAAAAMRSDCRRSKVGSVIARPDGSIAGTGYVGTEPGAAGCLAGACPRGRLSFAEQPHGGSYDNCISRHSEDNAIRNSWGPLAGCTIYVTREPCAMCHELIRGAGITGAYWPGGWRHHAPPAGSALA
jgi:dCMP deaminase